MLDPIVATGCSLGNRTFRDEPHESANLRSRPCQIQACCCRNERSRTCPCLLFRGRGACAHPIDRSPECRLALEPFSHRSHGLPDRTDLDPEQAGQARRRRTTGIQLDQPRPRRAPCPGRHHVDRSGNFVARHEGRADCRRPDSGCTCTGFEKALVAVGVVRRGGSGCGSHSLH
ncbi:hypothetical protein D9M71_128270 [compost metagenome]